MSAHHKGYPATLHPLEIVQLERARLDKLRANLAAEFKRFDEIALRAVRPHAGLLETVAIAGELWRSGQRIRAEIHTAALQAEIAEADQAGRAL